MRNIKQTATVQPASTGCASTPRSGPRQMVTTWTGRMGMGKGGNQSSQLFWRLLERAVLQVGRGAYIEGVGSVCRAEPTERCGRGGKQGFRSITMASGHTACSLVGQEVEAPAVSVKPRDYRCANVNSMKLHGNSHNLTTNCKRLRRALRTMRRS